MMLLEFSPPPPPILHVLSIQDSKKDLLLENIILVKALHPPYTTPGGG